MQSELSTENVTQDSARILQDELSSCMVREFPPKASVSAMSGTVAGLYTHKHPVPMMTSMAAQLELLSHVAPPSSPHEV